jgi:hypothetical protein
VLQGRERVIVLCYGHSPGFGVGAPYDTIHDVDIMTNNTAHIYTIEPDAVIG